MVDENRNVPDRPDRQIGHGRESAGAAFYDELLCCYTCGKIYFTRRPIRLRTPGRRVFHICFECSHSLECASCGEPVTSRAAVVIEDFSDHTGGFFCPACRDQMCFGAPIRPRGPGARARLAVASARDAAQRLFRKIAGIRFRFRRHD